MDDRDRWGRRPHDPLRRCPKCGGFANIAHANFSHVGMPDALRRTCERCGYIWNEVPLDAVPATSHGRGFNTGATEVTNAGVRDEAVLCFIQDCWAYFTTQPLSQQRGDDWNDAPYQSNAGRPHTWRPTIQVRTAGGHGFVDAPNPEPRYEIFKVAFEGPDFETPDEVGRLTGRTFSVDQINRREIPWISHHDYQGKGWAVIAYAGITLQNFTGTIQAYEGTTYHPHPPKTPPTGQ